MKCFSVLLLAVAVVYVKCDHLTRGEALQIAAECQAKTSATEADIEAMLKREPAASSQAKCLRACVMHKLGVTDESGKMSKDGALQIIKSVGDGNADNDAVELVNACADIEVDTDACEAAEQYITCLRTNAEATGYDLDVKD